jgi:E3 ubiquitin-protein ligase HERC2
MGCDWDVCAPCFEDLEVQEMVYSDSPSEAIQTSDFIPGSHTPVTLPPSLSPVAHLPLAALRARWHCLRFFGNQILLPAIGFLDHLRTPENRRFRTWISFGLKENYLKRALASTMTSGRDHGPTIHINRALARELPAVEPINGNVPLPEPELVKKTIIGQVAASLVSNKSMRLRLNGRYWKCRFDGEGVDDFGGAYNESISEMMTELQQGKAGVLVPTPNSLMAFGTEQDAMLFNPQARDDTSKKVFHFLGWLIGFAIRSGEPIDLPLASVMWQLLLGEPLTLADVASYDNFFNTTIAQIRSQPASDELFDGLELDATLMMTGGQSVDVLPGVATITAGNKDLYCDRAVELRLFEFDEVVSIVRRGIAEVVPLAALSIFTPEELEELVCGSRDIDIPLLKSVTSYDGSHTRESKVITWFWEVLEEMTPEQRVAFVRFTWGRTRLPRTRADFKSVQFQITGLERSDIRSTREALPESYTCFFQLKLPRYSSKEMLREKLLFAIEFCRAIDTDFNADSDQGDDSDDYDEDEDDDDDDDYY